MSSAVRAPAKETWRSGALLVRVAIAALLIASPVCSRVEIVLEQPEAGRPVSGLTELVARVEANEPVVAVRFFVDGELVARLESPPWKVLVDLGQANREHRFRVVAEGRSGATAETSMATAAIRVDASIEVGLRQLYVTVSREGRRLLDLRPAEFEVYDEGSPQDLVTFGRGDVPLAAVLLLDGSESMAGTRLESALLGARTFVAGMKPLDEARVMVFSDRLLRASRFTSDRAELDRALSDLGAAGGTAINDYLFTALRLLDARQGRRVVLLFSDGADVHSVLGMAQVLTKARESQALIYWIRLQGASFGTPTFSSSWRDAEANEREFRLLEEAVAESGGRVEVVEREAQLAPAFAEILAELREQYVLGYYPSRSRNDGSWHKVTVRVSRPGVKVRTGGGYVDG